MCEVQRSWVFSTAQFGCTANSTVYGLQLVQREECERDLPISEGVALQFLWKGEEIRLLFSNSSAELRGREECICIRLRRESPSLTVGIGNPFLHQRNAELLNGNLPSTIDTPNFQLYFWVCIDIIRGWIVVGTSPTGEEREIGENVKIAYKVENNQFDITSLRFMTATNWEHEAEMHIIRHVPLSQSMKTYFRSQLKFDEEGNMKHIYGITMICWLKEEDVRTCVQKIQNRISSSPYVAPHFAFTSLQSLHMTVIDLLLLTSSNVSSIHTWLNQLRDANPLYRNDNDDDDRKHNGSGGDEEEQKEVAIRLHRTAKRMLEVKKLWRTFQDMTFSMRVNRLFINAKVVSLVLTPIDEITATAIRKWRLLISEGLDDLQYCNPADPHYVFHITIGYCYVPTFDNEFGAECEKLSLEVQPLIDALPVIHFSPPLLSYFTSMNSFISEF